MPQLRVLRGFTQASDHSLDETAGAVIEHLYGNATYPTPPVTEAALTTAQTTFSTAVANQGTGGPVGTADRTS